MEWIGKADKHVYIKHFSREFDSYGFMSFTCNAWLCSSCSDEDTCIPVDKPLPKRYLALWKEAEV
jgi:hypothetical protein